MKILIVDDSPDIVRIVSGGLRDEGFEVTAVSDGAAAMAAVRAARPDLILLDLKLPSRSGLDICRELRADPWLRSIPVVMLTALATEVDRIVGLEVGADDYVVKPFSVRELVLRIKAILRRTSPVDRPCFDRIGAVAIDASQRRVVVGDAPVNLTAKEFELLTTLVGARGRALSRAFLLRTVWGYEHADVRTRTIDVHVRHVRRKLGAESWRIETVDRYGYRLNTASAPPQSMSRENLRTVNTSRTGP